MECPSCHIVIPDGSKFCMGCGAALATGCPSCGHGNPAGATFCLQCGQKLTADHGGPATKPPIATVAPRPSQAAASAERRQLTVMFCDLVGSTALSARLDPEDMREIIGAYHHCCAEQIVKAGGFVAKYMGDGVLAYFGYPQAHEDDAERAVRGALSLIETVPKLRTGHDAVLEVRIGIATGLVVVGDLIGEGAAGEPVIVGETPNLAARLQSAADPDSVVISAGTHSLIGGVFRCREFGPLALKGFPEPTPAWQVLSESGAESRFDALHSTSLMPIVGRQEEISLLLERWEKAKEGEGQVVLISGEAGIGKSRVTKSLRERLSHLDHVCLSYFSSPHYQTSALYPIITQLERAASITRDDTNEQKLDKLEGLLQQSKISLTETVPLMAALLSIPTGERYPPFALNPKQTKDKTFETLFARLHELCRQKPVLLVFEDIQWVDPTSLELIQLTIDRIRSLPILVVVTFRHEFIPPWPGQTHITPLSLNRLSRRQAALVVEQVAGGRHMPQEVLDQILARADGVPLFLEELTKTVLNSGLLAVENDRFTLYGPLPPLAVPATLHDSLMARLDRMSAVKQVAQLAATLGRTFTLELLGAVSPMPAQVLEHALAQLVNAEVMYREDRPPDAIFHFKHALLQEVAYESLLKSTRRQYHNRIARTLVDKFPNITAVQPELIAHHFTEGGQTAEAINYWQLAGKRATQRSANAEAIAQLNRAMALLESMPNVEVRARQEYQLLMGLIPPLIAAKGYAATEMENIIGRALQLSVEIRDASQIFPVLYSQFSYHNTRGQIYKAATLAEEFLRLSERQRAIDAVPIGKRMAGTYRALLGDPEAGRPFLEAAIAAYDMEKDRTSALTYGQDHLVVCAGYLCLVLWHLGLVDQALERYRQALSHARSLSHVNSLGVALTYGGGMLCTLCRDEISVEKYAEELSALGVRHKLPLWSATGSFFRGQASVGQGRFAEGITLMQEGLTALKAIHVDLFRPMYLAWLAAAFGKYGRPEQGLAALSEAWSVMESGGEYWMQADHYRIKGELLLLQSDTRKGEAEDCFKEAIKVARGQRSRSLELRAATSLARFWHGQLKFGGARRIVAEVYESFREGFEMPDLADARELLSESA